MRKLSILPIGLMLLLLPMSMGAEMPLYDRLKQEIERDVLPQQKQQDKALIEYITAYMKKDFTEVTSTEVAAMIRGEGYLECSKRTDESITECQTIIERVQALAANEGRIRTLGRTLQAAATSYELPVSDLPGRALKLSADLRAILNIWGAGTGSVKSSIKAPLTRSVPADEATFEPLLKEIGEQLTKLNDEQRTAAVWRYEYGVRLTRDERAPRFPAPPILPNSGPNTERQYLTRSWTDVEKALQAVWDEIKDDTFNPPLAKNEIVYFMFADSLRDKRLPDNVIVWARLDGDKTANFPFGDVGLQWRTPLEPVHPSLLQQDGETPILGGDYPPQPAGVKNGEVTEIDGGGLCTSPGALRGYLCRPFELLMTEERCPTPGDLNADEINLIHCTNTGSLRATAAGADVCREITWKVKKPFNPQTQCILALKCSDNCGSPDNAGLAKLKNAAGVVEVCVQNNKPGASYTLFHELVHAYQFCGMPPSTTANLYDSPGLDYDTASALCCRIEGEAYQAQCNMMERDGVLEGGSFQGISMTAQSCAEAGTYWGCKTFAHKGKQLKGCYTSMDYPREYLDAILMKMANSNPKKLPTACTDVLDPKKMDLRVKGLIDLINKHDGGCTPGQTDEYSNRIGNNMCYIGQCAQEAVEVHRIVGGQVPAIAQDGMAPWDSPETGTPLAGILANPSYKQYLLPSYRPQLLMREMETALCQLQGLPPLTPPILCAIDAARQLELPRVIGAQPAFAVINQRIQQELSTDDLINLSPALAARVGTTMYGTYLRESNRTFADIIAMANSLLKDLDKITFPTEMCPIGQGLPPPANQ
jgi:hypothetical protein